ncbi:exosome complex component RRP45A-like isoform X1 [Rhododendron vialii]|uniref:exosome complex component RRP45A-like isoform X1 n=2 Tax=Rhododendron vialii TaxID=182163 RepID=UPI00265ED14D|nr:exosome complex component RRP45A-like isoform X1 [Rhododendron vialii]XP_058226001.1 exosome complex component RRP45A-like isoform X1 [Rhododendron vialii]
MEQRLANTWKMTVNEKKFIETALVADIRVDGRRPFDYRRLTIKFGREDGSSEVQLGQTHVMGFVTSELVQPYRDRQNEGTLSIFTEFSPMADPSFEAGRAGESAVELARIIDRGLRESRAVDMESLCVIAGKLVWAIRVDLHILDNGGNLVDAANIAALAALSTFRRPEFTLGGEGGQEVIIHPPEVREPLPLVIHHFPIAVTFGFFGDDNIVVIDPTHKEESVMGGRMIATLNTNGDICAIQKAGRVAIMHTVIMQCLRIASVKAGDITSKIKNAVESYNTERALRKIKRHSSAALDVHKPVADWETQNQSVDQKRMSDLPGHQERLKPISKESGVSQSNNMEEVLTPNKPPEESTDEKPSETESDQLNADIMPAHSPDGAVGTVVETNRKNTLADAVKPKHKRKKKSSSNIDAS